jgi:ketosteroid isomerase-like protein
MNCCPHWRSGRYQVTTEAEVLAAAAHLVDAFGRHDTAAYFGSFAPDATFIFYTTPAKLASRADYERLWAEWERADDFRVLSCQSAGQMVQVIGAAAIFSHAVTTVVSTRAGEATVQERETIVFRRRAGGSWEAVHEHLSPRPESAQPESGAR